MKNFNIDKIKVSDGSNFGLEKHKTAYHGDYNQDSAEDRLRKLTKKIAKEQQKFYASDNHSLLIVFQAMDAAGKDGTIRRVMSGINPQGCNVSSFKAPSKLELDHDFLWRTTKSLPERGQIGIFNRSYYEEVLVCKVHPEYVLGQNIPSVTSLENLDTEFWSERYESINDFEKHISRNGTRVLKFFLNISKEEQKRRFLSRIDEQDKNWKFSYGDIKERRNWDKYMDAYQEMIKNTSTEKCPWHIIPADNKWFMRTCVSEIISETLDSMSHEYPVLPKKEMDLLDQAKKELLEE